MTSLSLGMRWQMVVLLALAMSAFAGCLRVRPWQRELLAQPAMQDPRWPMLRRHEQHVVTIREGTEGALGASGGGCGCN